MNKRPGFKIIILTKLDRPTRQIASSVDTNPGFNSRTMPFGKKDAPGVRERQFSKDDNSINLPSQSTESNNQKVNKPVPPPAVAKPKPMAPQMPFSLFNGDTPAKAVSFSEKEPIVRATSPTSPSPQAPLPQLAPPQNSRPKAVTQAKPMQPSNRPIAPPQLPWKASQAPAPAQTMRGGSNITFQSPRPAQTNIEISLNIKFTHLNVTRALRISLDSYVAELEKKAKILMVALTSEMKKQLSRDELDESKLWIEETAERMESEKTLSSYTLKQDQLILFTRDQIIIVTAPGMPSPVVFAVKFTATVKDVMKILRHNHVVSTHIQDWSIHALHFKDLIMEGDRTILSYRIPSGEKLELKIVQRDRKLSKFTQMSKEESGAVFLTIESPAHGLVKTFKFDLSATVQQTIDAFLEKHPVKSAQGMGLKYVVRSKDVLNDSAKEKKRRKKEEDEGTWLVPTRTLASYQLKNMDTLIYTQSETKIQNKGPPPASKKKVFGVDPISMETVEDNGFLVPSVLAVLRKHLIDNKGLEEEGIFRLAGSESKMKEIKGQLDTGTFTGNNDVHCIATLIKRWFGELPKRIFSNLRSDLLNSKFEAPEEAQALIEKLQGKISAFDKLIENEKQLIGWYLTLMVEVAKKRDKNKMTSENLAIVAAPILVDVSVGDPMENVILTQQAVAAVKYILGSRSGELKKAPSKGAPFLNRSGDSEAEPKSLLVIGVPVPSIFANAEKEGYLYKETKGVMKELQRKYFVLSDMNLYYFKTKHDLQPKYIPLAGASVYTFNENQISYFEVITPHRKYLLYSDSAIDVSEWVAAIREKLPSSTLYSEMETTSYNNTEDLELSFSGYNQYQNVDDVSEAASTKDSSVSNAELYIDINEEKKNHLATELINHPEYINMLMDPIYQQLFSWQKRAYLDGSLTLQDIFKNLQMMKRKKDDFEKMVSENIQNFLPVIMEDRSFIRFREGFNVFMDDPNYSTSVDEFLESVTNGI